MRDLSLALVVISTNAAVFLPWWLGLAGGLGGSTWHSTGDVKYKNVLPKSLVQCFRFLLKSVSFYMIQPSYSIFFLMLFFKMTFYCLACEICDIIASQFSFASHSLDLAVKLFTCLWFSQVSFLLSTFFADCFLFAYHIFSHILSEIC